MGNYFQIQRYCVNDGAGIRTGIFLKGCPLHCPWCHNPEGISRDKERDNQGTLYGAPIDVEALVNEAKKDAHYYRLSGGGVTLTGGEPLFLGDECVALAKRLKEEGISVCVETCGNVSSRTVKEILPYLDGVLFDVKSLDEEQLLSVTGGNLPLILRNLSLFDGAGVRITLRCPLIVGFNATEAHLTALSRLASLLKNVDSIQLLPYHKLGEDKRARFGLPTGGFRELTNEEKERAKTYASRFFDCVELL